MVIQNSLSKKQGKAKPRLKIPPVRIPSDDCLVYEGRIYNTTGVDKEGTPYPVHEKEWVEIIRVGSIGQYLNLTSLAISGMSLQDTERELADKIGDVKAITDSVNMLYEEIASRVVDWNWTDLTGEPLPNPYKRPDIIRSLSSDEVLWLRSAIQGETPAERKNA